LLWYNNNNQKQKYYLRGVNVPLPVTMLRKYLLKTFNTET